MSKIIILLGPPGSGKGTQAVRLSQELGLPHVSTGDLFRENIRNGTPIGKEAKSFIDAGQLVPDETVMKMLRERISRPDCANGYILDGFPRRVAQAEALEVKGEVHVLNLNVPDEEIVRRIAGRLTCKNGHIAHKEFSPPKKEGICDQCGEPLTQRPDDREEIVRERLRVYHKETAPVVSYYEKKGMLVHIDGKESPDQVFFALLKAVM